MVSATLNFLTRLDKPVLAAFGCIILLLLSGGLYSSSFLSPEYLLQQMQVASFLGLIATGLMLVILLGQIDLSVPWMVTLGGMMSTAAAGWGPLGATLAIPFGIICGMAMGLVSGFGVAYLRVPSMIFTLGLNAVIQGLMVLWTGGFAPQDHATDTMRFIATGRSILSIPNVVFVWAAIAIVVIFTLTRTIFGRTIYATGNRERAAYLSGLATQRVVMFVFMISGGLSAATGVLLAGYSAKAYQGMGDTYLLPAVAAVVLGGTNILGGKGSYIGTIAGVILITLLQSMLSVMAIDEAGRQLIYGVVIILMLLLYGRQRRVI